MTFSDLPRDRRDEVTILGRDLDRTIKITCPRQGNRIINREADDQKEYPSTRKLCVEIITQYYREMCLINPWYAIFLIATILFFFSNLIYSWTLLVASEEQVKNK